MAARNSTLRYWVGLIFAVLFFGGFLFKSYWEEHVLERDTKRILKYYKSVIPGSIQDGDEHNARYLAWKYRGKKDKLWRSLEKKYGEPVRDLHEYPDSNDEQGEDEDEEQNLDEETQTGNGGGGEKEEETPAEEQQKEEPDL